MKAITWSVIIIIIGAVFVAFFMSGNTGSSSTTSGSADSQKVNIGMKNGNYYPQIIKVKVGQPVSITLDSSVTGCYRGFNIRDLGVSAVSRSPSQTIDFTPTKTGTFRFACSMGMGTGTIVVE